MPVFTSRHSRESGNLLERRVIRINEKMNKQTAIEMKELSINAVESLGKILRLPNIGSDPIFHKKIHRAVGELIGEIEVKLHAEIYKEFPELDDLK